MSVEIHIAGILIHARADLAAQVAETISAWPQADVCATNEAGKLVVVSECDNAEDMSSLMARMRDLPGVLNVALVYQHAETAAALDKEIDHEDDAPRVH